MYISLAVSRATVADTRLQAIQSIEAQWSKNTEKVVLKVDIVEVGVDICMF